MKTPSPELLQQVRGLFIQQGTSFTKWCEANGVSRQWATAALRGYRNGPAAKALRKDILKKVKGIAA